MSSKYKFVDKAGIYFTTSTIVDWVDLFTRDIYRNILLDSLRYCQQNQGLRIHPWVLMPSHLHMICSAKEGHELGKTLRNCKAFTAMQLIDALIKHSHESRRKWILERFEKSGKASSINHRFQCWQHENHPFLLNNAITYGQRLNYLHENPVRAGFVTAPEYWQHSSAKEYLTDERGLLPLEILE